MEKMEINISIMSGAGNIFAVIDNSKINLSKEFYTSICPVIINSPEFDKINCEGVLILNCSNEFDFDVWFFNPDGTTGMMCGNGGRCAFAYAFNHQIIKSLKDIYSFSMSGNIYKSHFSKELISLYLPTPIEIKPEFEVKIDGISIIGTYINIGSDHFIFNYENSELKNKFDFSSNELIEFVKKIRHRFDLFPRGTNVNYYKKNIDTSFLLRTYERGVENITGACGTGAISTAWHLVNIQQSEYPVTIYPPSGLKLIVDIEKNNQEIKNLILTGSADLINKFTINV
jgi:diaminopimelate epimerase